jgi:hypothetical protein
MDAPRKATAIEAGQLLHAYRSDHRIVPVGRRDAETCEVCLVPVYRIKGGWRHNHGEIRVLVEKAPLGFPREK